MLVTTDDTILVTFRVRRPPGAQDCQGNPEFSVPIKLPAALGNHKLLDGSTVPPRDATVPAE